MRDLQSVRPKRILLIKTRALGDSIIGLSAVEFLKNTYPDSEIIYGVPSWVFPLYRGKNVSTPADQVIPISLNNFSEALTLFWKIRDFKVDIIFELHQSGRTGNFLKILSFLLGIPYRFHNHHETVQDRKAIIQRDLDGLIKGFELEKSKGSYLKYPPKINISKSAKEISSFVIFGVVATRKTKMWPLESYIDLAKKIKVMNSELVIKVPLSRSDEDQKIKKALSEAPNLFSFVEKSLSDLPEELAGAKLYIGNDTGLKHLSVALNIKTYTFFGPEEPLEWHPYDSKEHPYFFIDDLSCRTEISHFCPLSECSSMICLKNISSDSVFKEIESFL